MTEERKKRKQTPKARSWCFTIFDMTDHWPEMMKEGIKYLCVQGEESPETKKFHWQGFMQTSENITMKMAQRLLAPYAATMHMEAMKGTPEQARDYCKKVETMIVPPREFGEFCKGRGHRTDLEYVAGIVKKGGTMLDVIEAAPATFVRYHRGLEKLEDLMMIKHEKKAPRVEWFVGPPGAGKSYAAKQENPGAFWKSPGWWWDGYMPTIHKTVVIDEWTPDDKMGAQFLLRILDENKVNVEPKGRSVPFLAEKIVITSNYEPENAVPAAQVGPLLRRINQIRRFAARVVAQPAVVEVEVPPVAREGATGDR